ncbi:MAG TPA: PfkB family carbohydrate kinase [Tabrizicola sp.]|nr:PfkB family carbohydrate kinase [Tabrizicola sp.]
MPQPPVVLVVGSLHHDIMIETDRLPRRDETAVGHRWYAKFGGKGGNQAVAAQLSGVRSRMFGAVGRDGFGTFLLEALDKAGVDRHFVRQIEGVGSGMSVAIQDSAGDYAATIVSGANLRLDARALEDHRLWQDVAVLVLQNEIPAEINLTAARAAGARGVAVVLNAAPARAVAPDLAEAVDVLVVNAVEAEMFGAQPVLDLTSALAAARYLSASFASVVVTAGAEGLAMRTRQGDETTVAARKVTVASTHGAGDCFTGTLAAALALGQSLPDAGRTASEAAAEHVAGRHRPTDPPR